MQFNILTIVVMFLTAQNALGSPSIILGLISVITGATTVAALPTVTDITTIPAITAAGIIQSAIDVNQQLITYFNAVLTQLAADTGSNITSKIGGANQVIENASTTESKVVEYISDGLESVISKSYTNQIGQLDDKIVAVTNAIADASAAVHNSNIATTIGATLTNITNSALGTVGNALAKYPTVTLIANAVKTLSKIAVLNELVDKIANYTNAALDLIPAPTGILTTIKNILNTKGADLTNPINNALEAGVDLSTITIPVTATIKNTVTDIIVVLNNGIGELTVVINALQNTTTGTVVATETAFAKITLVLVRSAAGSSGIISNILAAVANTVTGIISVVQTYFPTLASLLSVFNGSVGQGIASNFISCVTSEITTLQNYKAQYLALIDEYKTELTNGNINASTVENTIKLSANVALEWEIADFKIYDCGCIKAATTANVVLPAVKTIVSKLL